MADARVLVESVGTGRWLDSFCYLRDADREFTIANSESVASAR